MYERYKYASKRAYRQGVECRWKIVNFIDEYIKEHGYSPLQREIVEGTGIGKTSVNLYIWKLVDAGILEIDCNAKSRRNVKVADGWISNAEIFESEVI